MAQLEENRLNKKVYSPYKDDISRFYTLCEVAHATWFPWRRRRKFRDAVEQFLRLELFRNPTSVEETSQKNPTQALYDAVLLDIYPCNGTISPELIKKVILQNKQAVKWLITGLKVFAEKPNFNKDLYALIPLFQKAEEGDRLLWQLAEGFDYSMVTLQHAIDKGHRLNLDMCFDLFVSRETPNASHVYLRDKLKQRYEIDGHEGKAFCFKEIRALHVAVSDAQSHWWSKWVKKSRERKINTAVELFLRGSSNQWYALHQLVEFLNKTKLSVDQELRKLLITHPFVLKLFQEPAFLSNFQKAFIHGTMSQAMLRSDWLSEIRYLHQVQALLVFFAGTDASRGIQEQLKEKICNNPSSVQGCNDNIMFQETSNLFDEDLKQELLKMYEKHQQQALPMNNSDDLIATNEGIELQCIARRSPITVETSVNNTLNIPGTSGVLRSSSMGDEGESGNPSPAQRVSLVV